MQKHTPPYSKSWQILNIITITFMLGGLSIAFAILPPVDISTQEKRRLSKFPTVSVKTLMDGILAKQSREYRSEQFPFREEFLTLNFIYKSNLGFSSEVIYADVMIKEMQADFVEPSDLSSQSSEPEVSRPLKSKVLSQKQEKPDIKKPDIKKIESKSPVKTARNDVAIKKHKPTASQHSRIKQKSPKDVIISKGLIICCSRVLQVYRGRVTGSKKFVSAVKQLKKNVENPYCNYSWTETYMEW